MQPSVMNRLPELVELERLLDVIGNRARISTLGQVHYQELTFPLYGIAMGSTDPKAPTLGLFGGVHGLERIGTQVLISYLHTIVELLSWDRALAELLEKTRLLFMPLINPGGMYLMRRSNVNGIDLMRNAPVHAEKMSPLALFGGHRISKHLPWYRGEAGANMEVEARAVCEFVQKEMFQSQVSIALDVHSGFGTRDRIWFPYAKTRKPFPNLVEIFALKQLLDRTYPNHVYIVEPQSKQYTTHGDLWDHLYDEHRKFDKETPATKEFFLPLTLELGSWIWAKKNMKQVFSVLGAFNPMEPHRLQRTLRRHLLFFEFLHRAVLSSETWASLPKAKRDPLKRRALELWYAP